MHQFKSFPVPLSIRALHLPVLFTKKMVNPDNKVQLHHIRLRRCAHNVRTCYAGNARGIVHLRREMKAYFWPVDGSTWVKQRPPPSPLCAFSTQLCNPFKTAFLQTYPAKYAMMLPSRGVTLGGMFETAAKY